MPARAMLPKRKLPPKKLQSNFYGKRYIRGQPCAVRFFVVYKQNCETPIDMESSLWYTVYVDIIVALYYTEFN